MRDILSLLRAIDAIDAIGGPHPALGLGFPARMATHNSGPGGPGNRRSGVAAAKRAARKRRNQLREGRRSC